MALKTFNPTTPSQRQLVIVEQLVGLLVDEDLVRAFDR